MTAHPAPHARPVEPMVDRGRGDDLRLFEEVLDALGHQLVVLDEHGTIIAANAQWRITARAHGLGLPDDGVGASYLEACERVIGAEADEARRVARGIRDVLEQRAASYAHEYEMVGGGRTQEYRLAVHALHESRGAVVTHTDVTEVRRAERARIEALAHFVATFENALDAMVLVDSDGTVREANGAAAALFAALPAPLVGRNLTDAFAPAGDGGRSMLASLLQPSANRGLVRVRGLGDSVLDLEYAARADVQPGRHLLVFRDVTDVRRLEGELRQAQKMEAVGQLTGGIAHDFNNILTVVLGNAEFLLHDGARSALPADSISALEDIAATASRGAETVRKLMAFARKDALRPVPTDPATLLRDIARLLQRVLPESIHLSLEIPPGLSAVRVDASALQQILLNLCTNARDAMGTEGGSITIRGGWEPGAADDSAAAASASVRHVTVSVTDTGSGMSADVVAHLFEPFFTTKEVGKGTGLGMPMVYGIMAQHGGRVSIDTALGRGTTVTLHFPIAAPEAVSPDGGAGAAAQRPGGSVGRLLLIEDNPAIRRVSQQVLTRAGYTVQLAANGAEGAAALRHATTPYDLVVSDVVMPHGGGGLVAEAVAQHAPQLPILWITGYASDGVPPRPAGITAPWRTLLKPWSVTELLAAVRDAVPARHASQVPDRGVPA